MIALYGDNLLLRIISNGVTPLLSFTIEWHHPPNHKSFVYYNI